jgi:cytidine deaminase
MKQESIAFSYSVYESIQELSAEDRWLMEQAMAACHRAYAPYSGFRVGSALLLDDGTLITGSNQEHAAFPSGLCAERVAFFHVGSTYPEKKITAVAIAALLGDDLLPHPVSPCGNCRQVMAEFEGRYGQPIRLIMLAENNKYVVLPAIRLLLPFLFSSESLKPR